MALSNSDTQTERLVLALREQILQGEFSPGERLTEIGLASRLKASRTPIRLALERLANEGLLDANPSGGFRLRSFSLADIQDAIEIRGILEGTAARFAAERLRATEELAQLKRLSSEATMEIPVTLGGFARYLEANKNGGHREPRGRPGRGGGAGTFQAFEAQSRTRPPNKGVELPSPGIVVSCEPITDNWPFA